jgi:hypothetical protein
LGRVKNSPEIECLSLELAERQHPEAVKIEALRASALVLARRIDEIRCSTGSDLTDLLAK